MMTITKYGVTVKIDIRFTTGVLALLANTDIGLEVTGTDVGELAGLVAGDIFVVNPTGPDDGAPVWSLVLTEPAVYADGVLRLRGRVKP